MTAATLAGKLRHVAAFGVAGLSAFAVDAAILSLLVQLGADPYLARLVAIACAMVVGWLANRTWTFRAPGPPRLGEFLRYASVASLSVAVNYAVYAAVLAAWSGATPLRALVAGTAVATLLSYLGYRLFAFGGVRPAASAPPAASSNATPGTE
ncbi:GtrA family protein [Kaistia adipata]|uniref:GtrA family protein n=1 Tax=Kaistia adipata TaxID=166954 RepID=UPI0012EC56A9|nr:GtrA family protein [Kaistia adipata]